MTTSGAAAVDARGWGWRHAGRRAWAVTDVSLRIDPGERVLLLGASGSGKSTLLHGLAGVLGGDDGGESRGDLLIDGTDAAAARGRVGLVLQDPDAQVVLARVGDDVAFGCENLAVPRDEIWSRVRDALDAVGLDRSLDRSTAQLSGGQKQRLALAGALAMRPGLVLLDEPTANLDPAGVAEVRDAVGRLLERHPATLVVVEHRVDVWLPLVTRVVVLGDGGVVADGAPADVLGREGARLARDGVWVPGIPPAVPPPPGPAGETLLRARGLAVARVAGVPVAGPLDLDVRAGEVLAITGPNGAGKSTLGLTLAGLLPPAAGELVATDALATEGGRGLGSGGGLGWGVGLGPDSASGGGLGSGVGLGPGSASGGGPEPGSASGGGPEPGSASGGGPEPKVGSITTTRRRRMPEPGVSRRRPDFRHGVEAGAGPVGARRREGAAVGVSPIRWRSRDLLTRIGMVFQEPEHQLLARTVRDELEVGPRALGRLDAARIDELLTRLRLDALAAANPFTLSGGEKRRLTVAAALATAPRVLVLDEPTFGQDARTWAELVALLAELRDEGAAIVAITHDLAVVDALRARRFELGGAP